MENKIKKSYIIILFAIIIVAVLTIIIVNKSSTDMAKERQLVSKPEITSTNWEDLIENATNPTDGTILEKKFVTKYGDEIKSDIQKIFIGEEGWGEYEYQHTIFINEDKVDSYFSDDDSINLREIYNVNGLTAYSISNVIFCKGKEDKKFIRLSENQNYEEIKPLLYQLLKDGFLTDSDRLFENREAEAIKLIKEYVAGDFSNSNFSNADDDKKWAIQEIAKITVEQFGL